jgi:GTP-binding protein
LNPSAPKLKKNSGIRIAEAEFLITAVEAAGYPPADRPEIAFSGRSNVGKSSMINALTARRKLVRVSNTPGRTRALNFFDVELLNGEARHKVRLADLPGYGFAKVSKDLRKTWEKMIGHYLSKRETLKVVVSIIDAEVGPTPEDRRLLDFLCEGHAKVLVVATKIDRIAKAHRKPRARELVDLLELPEGVLLPFSATDRIHVDETWEALLSAL